MNWCWLWLNKSLKWEKLKPLRSTFCSFCKVKYFCVGLSANVQYMLKWKSHKGSFSAIQQNESPKCKTENKRGWKIIFKPKCSAVGQILIFADTTLGGFSNWRSQKRPKSISYCPGNQEQGNRSFPCRNTDDILSIDYKHAVVSSSQFML